MLVTYGQSGSLCSRGTLDRAITHVQAWQSAGDDRRLHHAA